MTVPADLDAAPGDLWGEVIGQDQVVAQLRAAVASPVHAYLLVGPEGSGKLAAARAFAAELLADGLDAEGAARARRLVAADEHPALLQFRPIGQTFRVDDAAEVTAAASRKPPEGSRQVILVHGLEEANTASFPKLLKVVEEPPPGTFFVLPVTRVKVEMATIASRCVRLDLSAVPQADLERRLLDEGVEPDDARLAVSLAGGSLSRARLLANDPEVSRRRQLWRDVPSRLDGTGAAASVATDELLEAVDGLLEPLAARHADELDAFFATYESVGEDAPKGRTKQLTDRHKREVKKVRLDELRAGLATVVEVYRERMAGGGSHEDFLLVADRVQQLCDALEFNPSEPLQLRSLLLALPPLR